MNPDGSDARLIAAIRSASQPAWSPDGRLMLVASDQTGHFDIYLIAMDTGAIINLTHTPDFDEVDPIWKP
jgi:TolB protein